MHDTNISVQFVFQANFDLCLRPRLTSAASSQLAALLSLLQGIELDELPDQRRMKLTGRRFTSRDAYHAITDVESMDLHGQRVWKTRVPNKVKIFSWLYFKDRLSTRSNLHAKHILDHALCERCSQQPEDRQHVFFHCSGANAVWSKLSLEHVASLDDADIWNAQVPPGLASTLWPFVLLTLLWRLWESRNGAIFRNEHPSPRTIVTRVCDDLLTWRKRLKADQAPKLDSNLAFVPPIL
jgi:hypothetical protein